MINLRDIQEACENLQGSIHRTPLLHSQTLDSRLGISVWLKAENFQKVGAFKIRGATNWLKQAKKTGRKLSGVITYSSGNHGQGVALGAKDAGLPAMIVVPEDAARSKVEAIRGYGAEVVFAGTSSMQRRTKAEQIAAEKGYAVIPPFDDPWIIAGQGTIALEILEEIPQLGSLLVPVGGGGLLAGNALAVKSVRPQCQVIGVQTELADSMVQSFEQGRLVSTNPGDTLADGMRVSTPGELNFEICRQHVDRMVRVSNEDLIQALFFLLTRLKILVEPSGAAAFSALLSGKCRPPAPCAVILSGGNVELDRLAEWIPRYRESCM